MRVTSEKPKVTGQGKKEIAQEMKASGREIWMTGQEMQVTEKELRAKRSYGRLALLLVLALLLTCSPVNWRDVLGNGLGDSSESREEMNSGSAEIFAATSNASRATELDSAPTVTVSAVNVKNTDILEVGIQVGGDNQPLFQSVGLVLEYDPTKLTPMDWEPSWKETVGGAGGGETGTASEVDTPTAVSPAAVKIEGEGDWKSLAAYTPTWINSGTAQVYEPAATSGEGGRTAGTGKGYLLLQADTEYPYSLPTQRQVVTVKFQYTGKSVSTDGAVTVAKQFKDVGLALAGAGMGASTEEQQAGRNAAYGSRIGHVGLYSASNTAATRLYYNTPLKEETGGKIVEDTSLAAAKLTVDFGASIEEGETQQTSGGGDLSNAVPVLLFDWDQTTLIGSVTVDQGNLDNVDTAMKQYTATLMSPENAAAYVKEDYLKPPAGTAADDYIPPSYYDADYVLNNKKGYTFGKWVNLSSDTVTIYGRANDKTNRNFIVTIPEPDDELLDLSAGYIALKAVYSSNEEIQKNGMNVDSASALRDYTIELQKGSFFNTGNFSVVLHVKREQGAKGVHRCRDAALRIQMAAESGTIYQMVELSEQDDVMVEIPVNQGSNYMTATVVDKDGIVNWVGQPAARSQMFRIDRDDSGDELGYVNNGYVGYISQLAVTGETIVKTQLDRAGLTMNKVYHFTTGSINARQAQVTANVLAALRMKNGGSTQAAMLSDILRVSYLTREEAQTAISEGTYQGEPIDAYYPDAG